ncbi:HNH endonuclease signature motif containing protein [Corynebacterium sp. NML130628]|uniref:HNH endonuclease signature motif containing protein n=1 Tax=Corynebacterium sp. NML130628 TaxID=1906333 RepID=UPI0008FBA3C3|nr:HNH endonuclease signature motif containing protein [Corynebacterium sp. NML130628]OIR43684.1 hypothetical protein BJP07_06815 [Corynebacterium sp. NML130628]
MHTTIDAEAIVNTIVDSARLFAYSHAEILSAIAEFDAHNLAETYGCASTGAWLARVLKMKRTRAYEYAAVARKLTGFPAILTALRNGHIDYTSVRYMLDYATYANEEELINIATHSGYQGLVTALAGASPTGGEPADAGEACGLHLREDGEYIRGWFCMNATDGAAFQAALRAGAHAYVDENALDEADAAMMRSTFGLPPRRLMLQSLMGMVHMVRTGAAKHATMAPAAQVMVHMTTDGRAFLPNHMAAPATRIANLVDHGDLMGVLYDSQGQMIKFGRKRRLASPKQVQVLLGMWGHKCAVPGCGHTRFLQTHHIRDWAEGGATDLENLVPLCSRCHSLVTDGFNRVVKPGPTLFFRFASGEQWVCEPGRVGYRDDDAEIEMDGWGMDSFADETAPTWDWDRPKT